jgi:hypothetical protein
MKNGLKMAVVAALLATGGAFAQGTPSASKGTTASKQTSSNKLVIDEKHHQQMMDDIKKLQADIASLKTQLAEERKRGIDPAHHEEMMAKQRASDQSIESVEKRAQGLDQELSNVPKYQSQTNLDRP